MCIIEKLVRHDIMPGMRRYDFLYSASPYTWDHIEKQSHQDLPAASFITGDSRWGTHLCIQRIMERKPVHGDIIMPEKWNIGATREVLTEAYKTHNGPFWMVLMDAHLIKNNI